MYRFTQKKVAFDKIFKAEVELISIQEKK